VQLQLKTIATRYSFRYISGIGHRQRPIAAQDNANGLRELKW
jgi:hypothetical protein